MDITSILLTLVGLAVFVGFIFGVTALAIRIRTKLGRGGVYDLRAGRRYVVVQGFTDHHGGRFEAGEQLTFRRHDYLPYHGGHTVEFEERTVYLQDEDSAEVLGRLWSYIEPAPRR
jgi:hypothetical protein